MCIVAFGATGNTLDRLRYFCFRIIVFQVLKGGFEVSFQRIQVFKAVIGFFGLGSVLGMAALSGLVGAPLARFTTRRPVQVAALVATGHPWPAVVLVPTGAR